MKQEEHDEIVNKLKKQLGKMRYNLKACKQDVKIYKSVLKDLKAKQLQDKEVYMKNIRNK